MIFEDVLSESDKLRAERTLGKLFRHDVSWWALTGGFAAETHIKRRGGLAWIRPLHDIDFIVSSFDCIPTTLSEDFLFRHVHPNDPPGKTLLQGVDEETGVRVDVFRAYGSVMDRTVPLEEMSQSIRDLSRRPDGESGKTELGFARRSSCCPKVREGFSPATGSFNARGC